MGYFLSHYIFISALVSLLFINEYWIIHYFLNELLLILAFLDAWSLFSQSQMSGSGLYNTIKTVFELLSSKNLINNIFNYLQLLILAGEFIFIIFKHIQFIIVSLKLHLHCLNHLKKTCFFLNIWTLNIFHNNNINLLKYF